jgi:hypothetical protein
MPQAHSSLSVIHPLTASIRGDQINNKHRPYIERDKVQTRNQCYRHHYSYHDHRLSILDINTRTSSRIVLINSPASTNDDDVLVWSEHHTSPIETLRRIASENRDDTAPLFCECEQHAPHKWTTVEPALTDWIAISVNSSRDLELQGGRYLISKH